jgi:tripeptide aminopeptidase
MQTAVDVIIRIAELTATTDFTKQEKSKGKKSKKKK